MRRILGVYCDHASLQVLAVMIPVLGYIMAVWKLPRLGLIADAAGLEQLLDLMRFVGGVWFALQLALAGILAVAFRNAVAKQPEKALASFKLFCTMYLTSLLIFLTLSPMRFGVDGEALERVERTAGKETVEQLFHKETLLDRGVGRPLGVALDWAVESLTLILSLNFITLSLTFITAGLWSFISRIIRFLTGKRRAKESP